jgi:beta-N-acetylhexosaminidase
VGLNKARLVDPGQVARMVGREDNIAIGRQISDEAITLVRDNGQILPLKSTGTSTPSLPYLSTTEVQNRTLVLIFSDDIRGESGHAFVHEFRSRTPDANVIYVDPGTASAMTLPVMSAADQAERVIAAVYVVPVPGKVVKAGGSMKNTVQLADATGALLGQLLQHDAATTVVLAMGNPYLAAGFPSIQNYICAFSNAVVSEASVTRALFGEIPLRGHLPVTIPGIAQRGAGMDHWSGKQSGVAYGKSN